MCSFHFVYMAVAVDRISMLLVAVALGMEHVAETKSNKTA